MNIYELLKTATDRKASDLHLKVGSPPFLRIDGKLHPINSYPQISQEENQELIDSIMNEGQKKRFRITHEMDLAHSVPGLGRFRVNVFHQRGAVGVVFRVIPLAVKQIVDLNLPNVLESLSLTPRGLILCTGTTGSGKTTTLAAMINHLNKRRMNHIVTIEDPIEYIHTDAKSIISQREVGVDTVSFADAMRAVLRQDPDVILVGEMRDHITVETALQAAETGHLVLSTLHTTDAVETIMRILSFFPPHQQKQIRLSLASSLKAIISQRLLPRSDGQGRVPAVEIMVSTPMIRECLIDEMRTKYILDAMKEGVSQYGMQSFDQSLMTLVKMNLVTYNEALEWATNPDEFTLRYSGIQSTSGLALQDMESVMNDRVAGASSGTESAQDKKTGGKSSPIKGLDDLFDMGNTYTS